jgi:hypothetical protein
MPKYKKHLTTVNDELQIKKHKKAKMIVEETIRYLNEIATGKKEHQTHQIFRGDAIGLFIFM